MAIANGAANSSIVWASTQWESESSFIEPRGVLKKELMDQLRSPPSRSLEQCWSSWERD